MSRPSRGSARGKLVVISTLIVLAAGATSALPAFAATLKTQHYPTPKTTTSSADLATTIATAPSAQTTGYQYFSVTVKNDGPNSASNVIITGGTPPRSTFYCVTGIGAACGSVPAGVTCTAPTSAAPMTCTMATSLNSAGSVTIWMGFSHGFFLPGQAYCDSASASSSTPDPNTANNTASVCARVV